MTDNVEKFPTQKKPETKHETDPVKAFSLMRDQLAAASTEIAIALKSVDPKTEPTTFNTYRWLGGAFAECTKKIAELAVAADLKLAPPEEISIILIQIPTLLADLEIRAHEAVKVLDLDTLPPGNPREPEFEAALKILMATNKAYGALQQNLAALDGALTSETYKLGIMEEDRAKAWRVQRRKQLEEALINTEKQIAETNGFLDQLKKIKDDLISKLEDNDQMKFEGVDPSQPVKLGDE